MACTIYACSCTSTASSLLYGHIVSPPRSAYVRLITNRTLLQHPLAADRYHSVKIHPRDRAVEEAGATTYEYNFKYWHVWIYHRAQPVALMNGGSLAA